MGRMNERSLNGKTDGRAYFEIFWELTINCS